MDQNVDASSAAARPSIGFPLGLAILLVLLFCMSGFLICCLHWDKIRSLFRLSGDDDHVSDNIIQTSMDQLPQKTALHMRISEQNQPTSLLVSMPGDEVPKFVAVACPCNPPSVEKFTVTLQIKAAS